MARVAFSLIRLGEVTSGWVGFGKVGVGLDKVGVGWSRV